MDKRQQGATLRQLRQLPTKTDPEHQLGGPQSGLPPPFVIGQELAPYLIVGIDFGSNFCRVSTFSNGKLYAIQPYEYSALVEDALQIPRSERQLVYSLKGCLGGNWSFEHLDRAYTVGELTTKLLRAIKQQVETNTERMLAKAVIAVPACFTHWQRRTLMLAAEEAGVAVLGLINEPTAAALHACYSDNLKNGRYLVVSAGAYSFETTLVDVQNRLIETKAIKGNQSLSGQSLNMLLAQAAQRAWNIGEVDELIIEMDKAKKRLYMSGAVEIEVAERKNILSRSICGEWASGYMSGIESLFSEVLAAAHTSLEELSGVIVTGGAADLWLVQIALRQWFPPTRIHKGNVSAGASIHAALLVRQAKDWVVWDALAAPILVAQGKRVREVVAANSPLPINGHAALLPSDDGQVDSTILQIEIDRDHATVEVARVRVVEPLERAGTESTVDLAVMATADGTLSFSARHKSLDVPLTVEVLDPQGQTPMVIKLTGDAQRTVVKKGLYEPGLAVGVAQGKWLVFSVVEGSPACRAGIKVYDELLAIDDGQVQGHYSQIKERLCGAYGHHKKLRMANGEGVFVADVECRLPCDRSADELKLAIAESTISGDNRQLVYQLIDYTRSQTASGVECREEQYRASDRAVNIARGLVERDDNLLALTLVERTIVRLTRSDLDAGSAVDMCAEVLDLARISERMTSEVSAALLRLGNELTPLCVSDDVRRRRKQLFGLAYQIGNKSNVSVAALQMLWQSYFAAPGDDSWERLEIIPRPPDDRSD